MARRLRRLLGVLVLCLVVLGSAPVARAHDHDPQESGHPLRILAYALHPVGWMVDALIFRPADWVVHHEPFKTVFGCTD